MILWLRTHDEKLAAIAPDAIFEVKKNKDEYSFGLQGSRKVHLAVGPEEHMIRVREAFIEAIAGSDPGVYYARVEPVERSTSGQLRAVVYLVDPRSKRAMERGVALIPLPPEPAAEPEPEAPAGLTDDPNDPESDAMTAAG